MTAATVIKRQSAESLHAQLLQNLRIFLLDGNHLVASAAILRDGLAGFRFMCIVVAAETAGKSVMAKIVRIASPCNAHLRKNIFGVNLLHGLGRTLEWNLAGQREYCVSSRKWTGTVEATFGN